MAKKTEKKSMNKSEFVQTMVEQTGLEKSAVKNFLDKLEGVINDQLNSVGSMQIPGLMKIKKIHKEAVKGGKIVPNRFKPGEMTTTKDKPAVNVIKVKALKNLKSMVNS